MNPGAGAEAGDSEMWLKKTEKYCCATCFISVLKSLHFIQQQYIRICRNVYFYGCTHINASIKKRYVVVYTLILHFFECLEY